MNHSRYVKEPATVEAQLAKLEHRGCLIEDMTYAKGVLERVNYYRLANYFAVFQDGGAGKNYREGTSFHKVVRLYEFDRRLRGNLLIFLEEIEISMRAVISNFHALKYGALGYLNDSTFNHNHNHNRFMSRIDRLIETNTDMGFVSHHNRKYSGSFPLWVIMELFSFGMLTHFFQCMHKQDKKEIAAKHFGGRFSASHIESWLESLVGLRNHCAHYCRLYANKLEPVPKPLDCAPFKMSANLFSLIYVIKLMDKHDNARGLDGGEKLLSALSALSEEYEDAVDLQELGFPSGWEKMLL
ncbi:MAG: Abi family protein [Oscillospiraceae bacterium]|nr:Abi family protein [Oscillospiraceae bacterium]